jgi:pyrroloquinoline quinone (PQQ) biosynthesis protein C
MNAKDWCEAFGELARQTMSSPELDRYFSIPITKARAQIILQQLSLYVRHRRDCWAYVSGNCPVLAVKQKILGHEYEEVIRDQHSEHGHLDLIIRQGKSIGLGADDILNTKPIPSTTATLYSWAGCARKNTGSKGWRR